MNKERTTIILAFIAIYFIWGSTYLFNKMLIAEIAPFQIAGLRFTISGIIILIFALIRRVDFSINRKQLLNSYIAGILFLGVGNGAVVYGLKYIDSGFAALLVSSQPLILLFMLWILKGQKIVPKSYIGVFLGFVGIALLMYDQGMVAEISWKGIGLVFLALLSWGYASIFVGSASLPKNQFVNSAYQMLLAGISMLLFSYFVGEKQADLMNLSNSAYSSMIFLIIFGSIIAFTSFNYLLKKVSPEKVATSTYINPIVAMILGAIVLNERISFMAIVATAVLLSGVYFINSAKVKKA